MKHIFLLGTAFLLFPLSALVAAPIPVNVANGDFEDTSGTFPNGWEGEGAAMETTTPLQGSVSAKDAAIHQDFAATDADGLYNFQLDLMVRFDKTELTQRIRLRDDNNSGDIITLTFGSDGIYRYAGGWALGLAYPIEVGTLYHLRVVGSDLDQAGRSYILGISTDGVNYTTSAPITAFHGNAPGSNFETIRLESKSTYGGGAPGPGATWDAVSVLSFDEPPPPDKIVEISGVYPHLAMTNNDDECGVGAVVPWAGRLWAATYSPHSPNGSSSKLYEIDSSLARVVRPESVGGTPANRFIHTPSDQLIIGPYFIDASRNVRVLPYSVAPGRYTATAAHLSDPENRVYIFTMENGVYDVDVHDLSVVTRYPDVQTMGDRFLFGYHGKGAYTGQGLLVVANNGRPALQSDPTGPAGVLATWDGTTVADNGGSYFPGNDPNDTPEEVTKNPVAAQPDFIAGWNQLYKVQHCEVTGPGGIRGNPHPATDPVWTTGFDAKSVILRTLESGTWHTWRLPKGSYTCDGSHGWFTEWPRIRQIDPDTPGSPYLMHMHGLFYDFPATFSSSDFSGLSPICSYYKMPVDYCSFDGRLVIAKNDASKFSNNFVPRDQSNLWFGQLSDLQNWGAPSGKGGVWVNEEVADGEISDPFLINGFSRITLHLRNDGTASVPIDIEVSSGAGSWSALKSVTVPADGYVFENLTGTAAQWVRLRAGAASSDFTAFFHLANPYSHAPVASQGTDRFAALADVRDTAGVSGGIMRVMPGSDLKLEFASASGYHQIGGPMVLDDVDAPDAESALRSEIPTTKDFGGDDASVWIERGGVRFRLPRLDPLYDSPFGDAWPRGFREVVTERQLLNCHGTFYEIPRDSAGGIRKMKPLATHGKRISDFASWRGLFVMSGVLDSAPVSDSLVKSPSGAALWLGEIDDLWRMGEPRGKGGPWLDTAVSAGVPSDPYLMDGYDRKELRLSHASATPVAFTVQVDFLADGTWSTYGAFTVAPGETFTHVFPEGFQAHWVRVVSDADTTATAQFTYGPADHGGLLGSRGAYKKQQPYDESVRRAVVDPLADRPGEKGPAVGGPVQRAGFPAHFARVVRHSDFEDG